MARVPNPKMDVMASSANAGRPVGAHSARLGRAMERGHAPASRTDGVTALRDSMQFLRGFIRKPAQVGSIVPSSRLLEARIIRCAGIAQARTVVELGPGTGSTTRALLRAMSADARLLAIELDADFHAHIAKSVRDARFHLQQGSAE